MFNIYIGFDPREEIAFHVLSSSIIHGCSIPLSISPLHENLLNKTYSREFDKKQSNSFSYSRFLVPFLNNYSDIALYMDCDMMLTSDLAELTKVFDQHPECAVALVKHDYKPKSSTKYLNSKQYSYPKKNWSSFVLWNCSHPANSVITPEFINSATPAELHRFTWLKDHEIFNLGFQWNHLVGEYDKPEILPKNIHWTLGGPYFDEYSNTDYSDLWFKQLNRVNYCLQLKDLPNE